MIPESNDNQLTPLTGFWCLPEGKFDDENRQVLTDLYLPLLGTSAFSIYQLLWQKVPNKEIITDRQSHSVLLSLLDMDIKTFYQERLKLEALSLIKTYVKNDDIGSFNIYQLFTPYSPKEFFQDDLMSIFLLEKIGETQYKKLVNKYSQSDTVLNGAQDVSKDFLKVFKLNDNDLLNKPAIVLDTKSEFHNRTNRPETKMQSDQVQDFDLQLVEDRTGQLFKVSRDDILKNQSLLLSLHKFYGISEVTMIDLIGDTLNIVDNTIDAEGLKRVAEKRFEGRANISARVEQQPLNERQNSSKSNDPQSILIDRAKTTNPADFLADEKNQLGGFTGNSEARALRTLASRSILPTSVLNVMVHYILQTSPTLTLPLMETIANDWKRNGVKSPEDALKRINDFQNRPRKTRGYNRAPKKVEQATDWSKVKSKPVNNQNASQAEKSRLEMLRKLRNKDK